MWDLNWTYVKILNILTEHPLSTSRIRSVTFNRFAAENNSIRVFLERKGEREFAISSSDSLKRSARTTKKREEEAEGISAASRRKKRNPWDSPRGYLARNSRATMLRCTWGIPEQPRNTTSSNFARLSGHTIRFFFFLSRSF